MRHAFHKQFQCSFGEHNYLRWPSDLQVGVLSFADEPGTNSLTEEWLNWTANPNREPGIGCLWQSAPPGCVVEYWESRRLTLALRHKVLGSDLPPETTMPSIYSRSMNWNQTCLRIKKNLVYRSDIKDRARYALQLSQRIACRSNIMRGTPHKDMN